MRKKIICGVVSVCICSTQTIAETRVDEAVRLSKLTLSAIECAFLANDGNEAKRLGDIGIAAGKKFLDVIAKMNEEEQKTASPHIAILWRGVPGYNGDFVLGRVWQEMERITYDHLGDDTKMWDRKKAESYREKNCMIIR